MRKLTQLILAVTLFATITVVASPNVTATWTAPTTGSPVEYYVVEVYEGGELAFTAQPADTFVVFNEFVMLKEYTARVAGVDALGRQGPWSDWSEPYMWDEGAPGSCGVIVWR
jgi:hypothetical protein